jgi:hypothetical protein
MPEQRVVPEELAERFTRFLRSRWPSDAQAAKVLGASTSMIRKVRIGVRLPGRKLAIAIENESASFAEGAIRPSEWDAAVEPVEEQPATGTEG